MNTYNKGYHSNDDQNCEPISNHTQNLSPENNGEGSFKWENGFDCREHKGPPPRTLYTKDVIFKDDFEEFFDQFVSGTAFPELTRNTPGLQEKMALHEERVKEEVLNSNPVPIDVWCKANCPRFATSYMQRLLKRRGGRIITLEGNLVLAYPVDMVKALYGEYLDQSIKQVKRRLVNNARNKMRREEYASKNNLYKNKDLLVPYLKSLSNQVVSELDESTVLSGSGGSAVDNFFAVDDLNDSAISTDAQTLREDTGSVGSPLNASPAPTKKKPTERKTGPKNKDDTENKDKTENENKGG